MVDSSRVRPKITSAPLSAQISAERQYLNIHIFIQASEMEDFVSPFKYPEKPDYYADLGLHYTATLQEIKRAHNSLAKRYHPDKQGFGVFVDASEFRKIREAYEFLRDPSNRLTYDADYPRLRECWTQFHAWQGTNRRNKRLQRAEHIARQRKAAEAEQARQAEETQRAAREKAEREKEAARARKKT
ncbi:hypothetical protein PMIN06_010644 [Paraphaeosphaeria minitans]